MDRKVQPIQHLGISGIDLALQNAGYCDNKIAAVNYVGMQKNKAGVYVYEICFYDDNTGRLALGVVFVSQTPNGLHGEPGIVTAELAVDVEEL